MKAKSMVLIMIALGCGLGAAFGVNQMVVQGGSEAAPAVEKKPVLVVTSLINIADKITEENVKVEEWPVDMVPEGAVGSLDEIEDLYSLTNVLKGQTLLSEMIGEKDEIGIFVVPPGMRVMSIKVSQEDIVEGLLQPGDRVDITGVFRIEGKQIAKTFLRDVQIFSVDKKMDRIIDPDGKSRNAKTVSLLVKPDQVEKITVAKHNGNLLLSLRNLGDVDAGNYTKGGVTVEELAGLNENVEDREDVYSDKDDGKKPGLNDWLDRITQAKHDPLMPTSFPVTEPAPEPIKMVVMTSNGYKVYTWHDPNGMPEVSDGSAGMAPIAPPAIPLPPTTGTGAPTGNNAPPTNEAPVDEPIEEDE